MMIICVLLPLLRWTGHRWDVERNTDNHKHALEHAACPHAAVHVAANAAEESSWKWPSTGSAGPSKAQLSLISMLEVVFDFVLFCVSLTQMILQTVIGVLKLVLAAINP